MNPVRWSGCLLALLLAALALPAAETPAHPRPGPGDTALAAYFRSAAEEIARRGLNDIGTLADWEARRPFLRAELFEMLGLAPLPPRTDLKPVVTGQLERDSVIVEKLHFQSLPGLYVTANLYRPRTQTDPLPAILYLCGHGPVISNKVSYGNKVSYQHHGTWFAQNGYVCLIIDTVQLGEIQGVHHGSYREGMWWWNARGYTPAGVEAWNGIRALDYLATRSEVDPSRFGVTGRSGGGAYSWSVAALDPRVSAAAPVAGITDLHNHVVDGVVEGHCDCMFFVNTYRWDYPALAALVAPRPLLLVNTDADSIFPLDGIMRVHHQVKRIYQLHQAANQFGLAIGPGPHKDTQNLQMPVFRWFNQHLKGQDPTITNAALKLFRPEELKVFETLPAKATNPDIHNHFVPAATPPHPPADLESWQSQREHWMTLLSDKVFAAWPSRPPRLRLEERWSARKAGLRFRAFDFQSQPHVVLRLYTVQRVSLWKPDALVLNLLDDPASPGDAPASFNPAVPTHFRDWLAALRAQFAVELAAETEIQIQPAPVDNAGFDALAQYLETNHVLLAYFAPRGVGLDAWNPDPHKQIQIRRRFMLLGQTLEGMRVWDVRRAVQALHAVDGWDRLPLTLQARGNLACNALYASLFEPSIQRLDLWHLPNSHRSGPDYLNVLRWIDIPQAVAMAAEHRSVNLRDPHPHGWDYPQAVARNLSNAGK